VVPNYCSDTLVSPDMESNSASPRARRLSGILSSPHAQRRFVWFSASVFVAGLAVFLALVVFRGQSGTVAPLVSTAPTRAAQKPKTVPPSAAAIAIGRKFIETAVARKNLAEAYAFVIGDVKGGLTKKQWESGNIPVTPYPAGNASTTSFQVVYSHPTNALFELTLVARHGTSVRPDLRFRLGLERAGGKPNGRWLVNYWAPYYTIPIQPTP
jgi:hypothetical protein